MEIIYVPDEEFRAHVWAAEEKAELIGVDEKLRWQITREDGTKYICRPLSTKPL